MKEERREAANEPREGFWLQQRWRCHPKWAAEFLLRLTNLTYLDCSFNQIEQFPGDLFDCLFSLNVLLLSNNLMRNIPQSGFALRAKRVIGGTIKMFWAASVASCKLRQSPSRVLGQSGHGSQVEDWEEGSTSTHSTSLNREAITGNKLSRLSKFFLPILGGQSKGNTPL